MNTFLAASSGTNVAPLLLSALVIGLLFFFMIVRPQKRNAARHKAMLNDLSTGDEIITSGGIYGTIASMDDDSAQVLIAPNTTVRLSKRSIAMKKVAVDDTSNNVADESIVENS